jgi:glycosyltransferase involved in cell wall biosynthesis
LNNLGLGGTEKAAVRWAWGLQVRGHSVTVLTLKDGPRRAELEARGVPVRVVDAAAKSIAATLSEVLPEVLHVHAPGYPHEGDVLGEALRLMSHKVPVVQTNIFGHLTNPREEAWTDFRLFISWTSCVQAARRSFRKLDGSFFRRASVAVYPLDAIEPSPAGEVATFRKQLGVADDEVLFGRLSRPEPNKWTELALDAFRLAMRCNQKIKMLLREPPPLVAAGLRSSPDAGRFIILPITSDVEELRLTMSALDVVLHTSSIGESFGYGIAEPMNLGRPVITHSVPWQDQAQIELVRHGGCGFIASIPGAMASAMLHLVGDKSLCLAMGRAAQTHIRALANPEISLNRLEAIFRAAVEVRDNPFAIEDLEKARATAAYLDAHQFGHSLLEQVALRPLYYRVRFHEFRKRLG